MNNLELDAKHAELNALRAEKRGLLQQLHGGATEVEARIDAIYTRMTEIEAEIESGIETIWQA